MRLKTAFTKTSIVASFLISALLSGQVSADEFYKEKNEQADLNRRMAEQLKEEDKNLNQTIFSRNFRQKKPTEEELWAEEKYKGAVIFYKYSLQVFPKV